jgi:tRNA A-37 threonylcarbamoyl transferase component Bud32
MTGPGTTLRDRYRLVSQLGGRNAAMTWLAEDASTGRRCVVKELALGSLRAAEGSDAWKTVELFEREARVLARLDDPAVPRLLDSFRVEAEGDVRLYLVEELVEGRTLAAALADGRRPAERDVVALAIEVAEVLGRLHRRSPPIIHRDVKPSNVMVRDGDELSLAALIDFGAVREGMRREQQRRGETVAGTFGYMAPEQLEGRAVPASDLYALGATLVFALSRQDPASLAGDDGRIAFRDRVNVSDGFAAVLTRLLEPDAALRYRDAAALIRDLREVQRGRAPAVAARPARRWRARSIAAGAVAAIGIAAWLHDRGDLSARLLERTRGPITSLVFSSDGRTLAAASVHEARLTLWDTDRTQPRAELHHATFTALATSADGRTLAAATAPWDDLTGAEIEPRIELLDAGSAAPLRTLHLGGAGFVSALSFAPDGKRLAATANRYDERQRREVDGRVVVFALAADEAPTVVRRNGARLHGGVFLASGQLAFTVLDPHVTLVLLDPANGAARERWLGHGGLVGPMLVPPADGARLAWTDGGGERVTVLGGPRFDAEIPAGAPPRDLSYRAFVGGAFTPDGSAFYFPETEQSWFPWHRLPLAGPWASDVRLVRLRELVTGRLVRTFLAAPRGSNGMVRALATSGDGRLLAVGFGNDFDGRLELWRLR